MNVLVKAGKWSILIFAASLGVAVIALDVRVNTAFAQGTYRGDGDSDDVWGTKTQLNQAVSTTPSTGYGAFSANDINLMSHVVYGEARNQPFEGQVAVAAVILNRYQDSKFPHSISGIIFQPGAFTSVSNGQAWSGTSQTSQSAVLDAIHGWDPTHGALYYWNPATATSQWVWGQSIMLRIGNHVFAK